MELQRTVGHSSTSSAVPYHTLYASRDGVTGGVTGVVEQELGLVILDSGVVLDGGGTIEDLDFCLEQYQVNSNRPDKDMQTEIN